MRKNDFEIGETVYFWWYEKETVVEGEVVGYEDAEWPHSQRVYVRPKGSHELHDAFDEDFFYSEKEAVKDYLSACRGWVKRGEEETERKRKSLAELEKRFECLTS